MVPDCIAPPFPSIELLHVPKSLLVIREPIEAVEVFCLQLSRQQLEALGWKDSRMRRVAFCSRYAEARSKMKAKIANIGKVPEKKAPPTFSSRPEYRGSRHECGAPLKQCLHWITMELV
jgi:hypothetical protein